MPDLMQNEFLQPFANVSPAAAMVRLTAAIVLGGLIGWEREIHEKAAGLRTHMLISLAACLFTLITFDLMSVPSSGQNTLRIDPLRLIQAVTAGVAFLSAGVIITKGDAVKGLTTGAGMWLAGAIGLACGIGNLVLAGMAVGLAIIILWLLRLLPTEQRHHQQRQHHDEHD